MKEELVAPIMLNVVVINIVIVVRNALEVVAGADPPVFLFLACVDLLTDVPSTMTLFRQLVQSNLLFILNLALATIIAALPVLLLTAAFGLALRAIIPTLPVPIMVAPILPISVSLVESSDLPLVLAIFTRVLLALLLMAVCGLGLRAIIPLLLAITLDVPTPLISAFHMPHLILLIILFQYILFPLRIILFPLFRPHLAAVITIPAVLVALLILLACGIQILLLTVNPKSSVTLLIVPSPWLQQTLLLLLPRLA